VGGAVWVLDVERFCVVVLVVAGVVYSVAVAFDR
jgi:hypothetical protein